MQRETTSYFITLTYSEASLTGVSGITRLMDEHKRELCNSLRKMARKENWGYSVEISPCLWVAYSDKKIRARPHFHILIEGNPGATIAQYIYDYWESREYGYANKKKCYDVKGVQRYIQSQALKTWKQQEAVEKLETNNDKQTPNIIAVEEQQPLCTCLLITSYTNSVTGKVMTIAQRIVETVRQGLRAFPIPRRVLMFSG